MNSQEEIVISGASGRFPECENIADFIDSLIKGDDFVTETSRRFKPGFRGTPKRSGTIPTVEKFDNIFFGVPHAQVNGLDPRNRILLEAVYECIIDAGFNPTELRGTRTGVYVGMSSFDAYGGKGSQGRGIGVLGCLAANKISHVFDFKGPSYICDTACSSSFYVLHNAFKDLQSDQIENAIVAAANINFDPYETAECVRIGVLSPDGYNRSFSQHRNGYVRSEAVVSLLLQKKANSRRIYATILGAKLNSDGFKEEGLNFPSSDSQLQLMRNVYEEYQINIDEITYFEAHGTGTGVGDDIECRAINEIFKKRDRELLIGSLKSNMGHAEIASGLCSIVKCIGMMQTGVIPSNLYYEPIDTTIPGIDSGKLKVVTGNTPFKGGLIAINCFGVGGANAHVVLRPHNEIKPAYNACKPRLIVASGRTPEGIEHFFEMVSKHRDDEEALALVDEIHKHNIDGHFYRGFMLLEDGGSKLIEKYKHSRPIWFVYSGVGCQWATMAKDLLQLETFRKTFERCAEALKTVGVNLYNLVTSDDPEVFRDISNTFVSISAVQIALTDVLRSLGVEPDGFIGHSLGELGCAYADGCLTPEEAILLSYARGYGFKSCKNKSVPGQMIAVGLSYKEAESLLPEGVFIACRNSSTLVTLSGPKEVVNSFLKDLLSKGIFAKEIQSCNYALHTKYIEEACLNTLELMRTKTFKHKKIRSNKWISTSIPEEEESPEWGKFSCPEYYYNNFRNQVLFEQGLKHVPKNAILIEIAPHGILQSILKKELPSDVTNVSLCDRNSQDNFNFFLEAIGRIYVAGGQPQLRNMYSQVVFPVSRGTSLISPFVAWDHGSSWATPTVRALESYGGNFTINLNKPEFSYLSGHLINGKIVMAGMAIVVMVWKIFAQEFFFTTFENIPIIMENLSFKRVTTIPPEGDINFYVNIVRKTGNFEVYESGDIVCSGSIKVAGTATHELTATPSEANRSNFLLNKNDVYKIFDLKDQIFHACFKCILNCDVNATRANIEWNGTFECFLEALLQMGAIGHPNCHDILLSSFISKIVIDYKQFLRQASKFNELEVQYLNNNGIATAKCEGILFLGIDQVKFPNKQREKSKPCLETYEFIYFEDANENTYTISTALNIAIQIVLQNAAGVIRRPRICELAEERAQETFETTLKEILDHQVFTDAKYSVVRPKELAQEYDVLILSEAVLPELHNSTINDFLNKDIFVIYYGNEDKIRNFGLDLLFQANTRESVLHLLRRQQNIMQKYATIEVDYNDLDWVENLQFALTTPRTIFVYSQGDDYTGIMGFMNCLSKETTQVKAVRIDDKNEHFDINKDLYKRQLMKGLNINVLRNGRWGTYVHFPLEATVRGEATNAAICLKTVSDFSSFTWEESPGSLGKSSHEIYVFYCGLNMIDVLHATGKLQDLQEYIAPLQEQYIGSEFSGIYNNRQRVMGIVKSGAISLQIHDIPDFLWEVPEHWSLEEAATVPFSYAICYYALFVKAHIRKADTIVLHMGANPLGKAAISLALHIGCKILISVLNNTEKNNLLETFKELAEDDIGYVDDITFQCKLKTLRDSTGIDLLVSCSAQGSNIFSIINCLKENGTYITLCPDDGFFQLGEKSTMLNKSYTSFRILPDSLFGANENIKVEINKLMREGIQNGSVRPLARQIFSEQELEVAFRLLSTEHVQSKLLIELRKEEEYLTSPQRSIVATKKIHVNPEKSYVLIGGAGLVGLELTDWLIRKGATKIILNGRKPISAGYKALCLHKWSKTPGVSVRFSTQDTSLFTGAKNLVEIADSLGPVGGVFHLALALRDNNFQQLTIDDFQVVLGSKIISAKNLDVITRSSCPALDHFVIFSSVSSGRGNAGQSNYGLANSAMENLCEKRKNDSLPGLAIHWGPFSDTGAPESLKLSSMFKNYLGPQSIASCLSSLEILMLQDHAICGCCIVPKKETTASDTNKTPLETVASILEINNLDSVDECLTLAQLGMDSLMAAEIKQTLHRNFHINLEIANLRNTTLSDLKQMK